MVEETGTMTGAGAGAGTGTAVGTAIVRVPVRRQRGLAGYKPQARRSDAFTRVQEETFLEALAQTCCVTDASRVAGIAAKAAYQRRRLDAGFAEAWQEALAAGYDAVEGKLLRYVLTEGATDGAAARAGQDGPDGDGAKEEEAGGDDEGGDAEAADASLFPLRFRHGLGKVTRGVPGWVQAGMLLLNRHRAAAQGKANGQRHHRVATVAETDALLEHRLDMLARSMARTA